MGQIASLKKTDELLRLNGLNAKKSFGQNFIINSKVVEDIVKGASIDKQTIVIEIGAGLGALSEELVKLAKKVIAYEIDKDLAPLLRKEIKDDNLEVINEDFLKVDLEKLLENYKDEKIYVISNLPYYITSEILKKLFICNVKITKIVAMMQKEVGNRLLKQNSNKDKNELTLISNFCSDMKVVKYVSKNDFLPRPQIDSIVIEFNIKETPISGEDYAKGIKVLFANRRKTIYNNLSEVMEKEKAIKLLNDCNLDLSIRSETLNQDEILLLIKKIKEVI